MSTEKTLRINSTSFDATVELATRLGTKMRGGEVIELTSDVGGGKTAFVSGLAKGMGSEDVVSSPSYTLNNVYNGKDLTLNHYDLYRLEDPGVMKYDIAEASADPKTVVAIEWAESVEDVLPPKRLKVAINATGENSREITLTSPSELEYLIEGIQT